MAENRTPRKRAPFREENTIAEWLLKDYHPIPEPMYHGSANWAKQVLGFDVYTQVPVDARAFARFVKARGYRRGKDIEWYAAAMLRQSALILRHYVGREIPKLGRLEREFDRLIIEALKHQDIGKGAQKARWVRGAPIKEKKAPGHAAVREAAAKIVPGRFRRVKAAQHSGSGNPARPSGM